MRLVFAVPSLAALSLAALLVAGCQDDHGGPAQRAGRSIDNTGQNIKDAVDPGPAQRAGRSVDRATGN